MNNKIEYTSNPNNDDLEFLTQKIHAETSGFGVWEPFAFFIRDDNHQIIAGCNGFIIFGVIYTDQLWVDPSHRKQGLGQALMDKVHEYGRTLKCSRATLSTMSFQDAQAFYERLGYSQDFELKGYINNSSNYFLGKNL